MKYSLVRDWRLQPLFRIVALVCLLIVGSEHAAFGDELSNGQWYATKLRLDTANKISTGKGVVIGVVDSGVDADHPALRGQVLPGADFTDSADVSQGDGLIDADGHGTGMASLIVGHGKIRGVAPSAKVLPVRIGDGGRRTNFAAAILWAVNHGARVINISSGAPLADPREKYAIDTAINNDVVVVASVGNSPPVSEVQYPARYPGVLAVGATDRSDRHPLVSVRGLNVLLCAPGVGISSARQSDSYAVATGTSDSAALVSGVAALVRSRFPTMSARSVIDRLTATAIDLGEPGRDDLYGFGLVDPVKALTAALPTQIASTDSATIAPTLRASQSSEHGRSRAYLIVTGWLLLALLAVAGIVVVLVAVRSRRR